MCVFLGGPRGRRIGGVWSALLVEARWALEEQVCVCCVAMLLLSEVFADPSFDPCWGGGERSAFVARSQWNGKRQLKACVLGFSCDSEVIRYPCIVLSNVGAGEPPHWHQVKR